MWGIFAFLASLPIAKGLEDWSVRQNTKPYLPQLTRYDNKLFNHERQKRLYTDYIFYQHDVNGKSLVGVPVWDRRDMYIEQLRKEGYLPDLSFNCDLDDKTPGYNYYTLEQEDKAAIGRPQKIVVLNALANNDFEAFLKAVDDAGGSSHALLYPKPIDISNPVGEDWDGGYPKFAEEWFELLLRTRNYDTAKDFYYKLETRKANEWIFQFLDEFQAFPPTYEKRAGWKPYYQYKEVPPGLFTKCLPKDGFGWKRYRSAEYYDSSSPGFVPPYSLGRLCNSGAWSVNVRGEIHQLHPEQYIVDYTKMPFSWSAPWNPKVILPEFYLFPNRGYQYTYHACGSAYRSYNEREKFYAADMDCQYKWIDPFSGEEWKFRYHIEPEEYPHEMRLASRKWRIEMEEAMHDIIFEDLEISHEYYKRREYFREHPHSFGYHSYVPPEVLEKAGVTY